MQIKMLAAISCAALLVACGESDMTAHATDNNAPELLDRDLLFGNPERAAVRISPDGTHLSWIAPLDGVLNVWIAPVADPAVARAVTSDTERGIRTYSWAYSSRHVIYLQDEGGDENWRIYSVAIDSGSEIDLTPMDGIAARIEQVSHRHPESILAGINDREAQLHDIYRIDLATGERTLIAENPGFASMISDDDYNVRFGTQMQQDGSMSILRRAAEGWEPFDVIPYEDTMTTNIVDIDAGGEHLLLVDSRGQDTAALTRQEIASGDVEVLFSDERADVSDAMTHPLTRKVEAVATNYDRVRWTVLDDAIDGDFSFLRDLAAGEFQVTSRTLDDDRWIVAYTASHQPVTYYLYDRGAGAAQYLFSNRPALENKPLAPMHPVIIESRDGLRMVSYLTLPLESTAGTGRRDESDNGNGPGSTRPDASVPMVLLVHGGPWARDAYGFNPYHQWLANRGYAVLSVNFRGSTGFGKSFVNAGDREWGAAMHDDLIDAVQWAVQEGITRSDTVAIMGGSYGGYAALAGLTFTPETFACGVSIVGPSNLVTLLESIPPYWAPMIEMFANRVGDHRTEEGREFLKTRSPLTYVERIQRPLLIGQGANDPRVRQHESDQIVDAMREREIPVTYVLYPDEGHGFARPENNKSFNAVTEGFLGACLGGRVQPIGDDFDGASIQVPEGAAFVEGLPEALEALNAEQPR